MDVDAECFMLRYPFGFFVVQGCSRLSLESVCAIDFPLAAGSLFDCHRFGGRSIRNPNRAGLRCAKMARFVLVDQNPTLVDKTGQFVDFVLYRVCGSRIFDLSITQTKDMTILNIYSGRVIFAGDFETILEVVLAAIISGANLRGADLFGAILAGANLSGANLREAILHSSNLRKADLRGADLRGAILRFADLRGADLRNADLRNADLRYADLRGADLRDADLRGADFIGANLEGVIG